MTKLSSELKPKPLEPAAVHALAPSCGAEKPSAFRMWRAVGILLVGIFALVMACASFGPAAEQLQGKYSKDGGVR